MENYILPILLLTIALIGFGLITGIISRSRAINSIWIIILIALFWPFAASFAISLYKSLPIWVVIILSIIIISAILRGVLSLFVGGEATGVFVFWRVASEGVCVAFQVCRVSVQVGDWEKVE